MAGVRAHVLVIDDEEDLLTIVRELLERAGYRVTCAQEARAGLRALVEEQPDLVLLDVRMPDLDGWQMLERIRSATDLPVLMLSVQGRELEKVRALKGGADDYVTKPFGRQELLARIEALLRRAAPASVETDYADATLALDFAERRLTVAGREVPLTPLEFKLLTAFVRHPNEVLSPGRLLELVWSSRHGDTDEVRTYVSYLRRKLRPAAPIETVRGFGYRYRA